MNDVWLLADDEIDEAFEPEPCPQCGGPGNLLGWLGRRCWYRCRCCGWDYSTLDPEEEEW